MKRSTDRFLTTHTGSLPRPEDLIRMMYAKEEGVPVDAAALAQRVAAAVGEVVRKQAAAGVDVINDGEMSKPSYATYIKDRLSGFGGAGNTFVYQDLVDFPNLAKRVFGDPGRSRRKTPACNAPIGVRDPQAARADVDHLKAALASVKASEAFLTAASPGVVSLFFRNEHYPTEEAYLFAIAEAMRQEYETIAEGRPRPADRLPRSRDGAAHPARRPEPPRVAQEGAAARRGARSRGQEHSAGAAADAPVLGQLRRTASLRRARWRT